jgi:hypothetical protein
VEKGYLDRQDPLSSQMHLWAILDLNLQSRKPNTEAELQRTWQELDAGLLTILAYSIT